MKQVIKSLKDLQSFANQLAQFLSVPVTLLLEGDLGSGKTTLTRFLIQALTGHAVEVPSPTFTLLQTYDTLKGPVHHYDLYRIAHWAEAIELGIEESFAHAITIIEWPSKISPLLPESYLRIRLTLVSEHERMLICEEKGALDAQLLAFIRESNPPSPDVPGG